MARQNGAIMNRSKKASCELENDRKKWPTWHHFRQRTEICLATVTWLILVLAVNKKSQVFDQDFPCAAPRDVAPRVLQFKESRTVPGISPSPLPVNRAFCAIPREESGEATGARDTGCAPEMSSLLSPLFSNLLHVHVDRPTSSFRSFVHLQ